MLFILTCSQEAFAVRVRLKEQITVSMVKIRAMASFVHPSSAFTLLTTWHRGDARELNEENPSVNFSSKVARID